MATRHWIEVLMTFALLFYLGAFFLARRHWEMHVTLAIYGFVLDMIATWLMVRMQRSGGVAFSDLPIAIQIHTALAVLAIGIFFVQAWLGLQALKHEIGKWQRYRRLHIRCAKFVFLPMWAIAYASGLSMFLK